MSVELIRSLALGTVPRVVGTIITAEHLRAWAAHPSRLPCDLVELRVDGFSDLPDWVEIGRQIEAQGTPVLATIRMAAEGGQWTGAEPDRQRLLEGALNNLSGIDVELSAAIAEPLARSARSLGKLCVLSFHDFHKTPPHAELEKMLARMLELGSVGKIAAAANSLEDVAILRSLLRQNRSAPICVIGMGPHGRETRLQFPLEGSCFTYGYLDAPGAPGQFSARELMRHFGRAVS